MNWKYFKYEEFACSCCETNLTRQTFISKLDAAREIAQVPFKILSGYRCKEHNANVGGSPASEHVEGLGADIEALTSHKMFKIVDALLKVGFTRIGINRGSIHVGMDTNKPKQVMWTYYK